MDRYWIYIEKQIHGPFEVQELLAFKGFSETSQVCMVGEDTWQPARQFPSIRFQLGPTTMNVAEITPRAPAPLPRPVFHPAPHATRVSSSGDYISPDFQFEILHQRPNLRLRRSTRQSYPPGNFRAVPLPQPSSSSMSRGVALLAVLISLTSGLWAYGVRPSLPAPVVKWWHSHFTTPPPIAHPLHQQRQATLQSPKPPPPHRPAPVSHPKHSKAVSHRRRSRRQAPAPVTHTSFTHTSRKPWFDLRDNSTHPHS